MSLPIWPWAIHGTKVRARRRPATISLDLESLEDRLVPSTTLTHDQWRQATFHVDDVSVANLPVTGIGRRGALGIQAQADSAASLIHLDQVFADYAYRGDGYSVAVIDTGIDYTHPDLGGGWGKRVVAGYDFVNHDSNPMDDNGHGTHVAGIIGSSSATYPGVAPHVNLIALKVLDASGSGNFGNVEDALQWVAVHQAQYHIAAVNLSLGTGDFTVNPYTFLDGDFATLKSEGVFIAVASGNDYYANNGTPGLAYPAISSQVVSVGAVWAGNFGAVSWVSGARDYSTAADRIVSFTERGPALDILAPGAMITSTYLHGGYTTMAGTSMASPAIAGAAAILHQALDATGHHIQASQDYILNLMQTTGKTVNDGDDENDNVVNSSLNFKRLDLLAALNKVTVTNASPVLSPIANQTATAAKALVITLNATDPNGDNITFSGRVIGGGGSAVAYNLDQSLGLRYAGSYFTNQYGANEKWMVGASNWYCILPNGEFRRWAGSMSATLQSAALLATLDQSFYADPSLLWNAQPPGNAPATLSFSGNKLTIFTPATYKGAFTVEVTASDGALSAQQRFTVAVRQANVAPTLSPIANQTVASGKSLSLTLNGDDVNGDSLAYSARVLGGTTPSQAYQLKQQLGLTYPGSYFTNFYGHGEKWLRGTNNQWYCILPDGEVHHWMGSAATTFAASGLVASMGASYFADPSLLWNAAAPIATSLTMKITGNTLALTPPANYKGAFDVEVTVSDGQQTGTQTIHVTVV
ncbi:MAG: S8 family serine peptidase [Planctomycetes bacterium]|nr:S8 family serine peptidase [Planctomycetota bacterium]